MRPLEASQWATLVKRGARVFIPPYAGHPRFLVEQMLANSGSFADVELLTPCTLGVAPWTRAGLTDKFRTVAFTVGPNLRSARQDARVEYIPASMHDVARLFLNLEIPIDVALIHVSSPDEDGYYSLGVNADVTLTAVRMAHTVIAQINPNMPLTHGCPRLHRSEIHYALEHEEDLFNVPRAPGSEMARRIGEYVSQLVHDGDTLHLDFSPIPQAVLPHLSGKRNLGIHTGVFTDAVMDAVKEGYINNSRKTLSKGLSVAASCVGSRELYDFVDDNPEVEIHSAEFVNDPANIALNERMVAICPAIEIDITGQVSFDSLGDEVFGGIGGRTDFLHGASMSKNGHSVIVLPSTAMADAQSRILTTLQPMTGVAVPRPEVHYVVTEFGIASLWGRSLRERCLELISIAHPDFRDDLLADARRHGLVPDFHQRAPVPLNDWGDVQSRVETFGGTDYTVRPLHPSDVRHLQEFFYSHKSETVRRRYGHRLGFMPDEQAYKLVNVDQNRDVALGVFEHIGEREIIRAVGRYYLDDAEKAANIALVVDENHRGRGLGGYLLDELANIARNRSLQSVRASVQPDNEEMLHVLREHGFTLGEATDKKTNIDCELAFTAASAA